MDDVQQPTAPAETPPPEQTPPAPPAVAPVDVAALQAWATQSSQRASAIAAALGISKDATVEQVQARIAQLSAKPDEPSDPRLAAREQQLVERERNNLIRVFGQNAVDALALADEARTLADQEEIVTRFNAAVDRAVAARTSAAPQTPAPTPTPEQAVPPEARLDLDVPGVVTATGIAPQYSEQETARMRESGNGPAEYLRRVFSPRA